MKPTNFAKVDDRIWCGARPNVTEAQWLIDQGVRTVLNLEWEQSDNAAFARLYNPTVALIRVKDFEPLPWFTPSIEDHHVVRALAAIRTAAPIVYVHCCSDQNRTGVIVAAYRILERNDDPAEVIADFRSYRGLWAWGDARYIAGLSARREDLLQRVANLVRVGL